MYTNWFYYILMFVIFSMIFRLIGPFILPILIIYSVYAIFKHRQQIKAMNDLRKAQKTFKDEWENVTQSKEYQNTSSDVIDADYTIRED